MYYILVSKNIFNKYRFQKKHFLMVSLQQNAMVSDYQL